MNTCRTCNAEIPPTGKRGRPAAYCGDACRPVAPVRTATATRPDVVKVCHCLTCGKDFDRPGSRGRIPTMCPTCKDTNRPDAGASVRETVLAALAEFDVATMQVGDLVKLVSDDNFGTYKVMSTDVAKDGSVMLYGGRNYAQRTSSGAYRMDVHAQYRSVLPCDVLGTIGHASDDA